MLQYSVKIPVEDQHLALDTVIYWFIAAVAFFQKFPTGYLFCFQPTHYVGILITLGALYTRPHFSVF